MGNIHSFRFNKVVTQFPKDCELKNKSFLLKFSILILTNSIHRSNPMFVLAQTSNLKRTCIMVIESLKRLNG